MELREGNLVISKCGRDKNNFFIVVQIKEDYVFLCDGDMRKVDKPKKKKIKHVQPTSKFSDYINECIKEGKTLTNKELRNEICKHVKEDLK